MRRSPARSPRWRGGRSPISLAAWIYATSRRRWSVPSCCLRTTRARAIWRRRSTARPSPSSVRAIRRSSSRTRTAGGSSPWPGQSIIRAPASIPPASRTTASPSSRPRRSRPSVSGWRRRRAAPAARSAERRGRSGGPATAGPGISGAPPPAPVLPDEGVPVGRRVGLREPRLEDLHPPLRVRDEIVKLHLEVADRSDEAGIDEVFEQVVLASLDVDLHEIDRPDPPLAAEVGRPGQANLARRDPLRVERGRVAGEPDAGGAGDGGQPEGMDRDPRVLPEARRHALRELGHRLEDLDAAGVPPEDVAGPLAGEAAQVEDQGVLVEIVVDPQGRVPLDREPGEQPAFLGRKVERPRQPDAEPAGLQGDPGGEPPHAGGSARTAPGARASSSTRQDPSTRNGLWPAAPGLPEPKKSPSTTWMTPTLLRG